MASSDGNELPDRNQAGHRAGSPSVPVAVPEFGCAHLHDRTARLGRIAVLVSFGLLLAAPLPLAVLDPHVRAAGPVLLIAVLTGGLSLSGLVAQSALPTRWRWLRPALNADQVLRWHRRIAALVVVGVVLHLVALAVEDPAEFVHLIGPSAPLRAKFAVVATGALFLLCVLSIWRQQLRLRYDIWRATHLGLTAIAVVTAVLHSVLVKHAEGGFWVVPQVWLLLSFGAVSVVSLVQFRLVRALRSRSTPYRIMAVEEEQGDAVTVNLAADGHEGMRFRPGQFAYLRVGDRALSLDEHPFSYSGNADRRDMPTFTLKQQGDFTSRLAELPAEARVLIDGPYGSFCPDSEASGFVLVCGGVGITPAFSLLTTLAERGDPRAHLLVLACPTPDEAPLGDKIQDLANRLDLEVVLVPSHAPTGWQGESGRRDSGKRRRLVPHDGRFRQAYLCGPPGLVKMATQTLVGIGVARRHIHAELFDSV